MSVRNGSDEGTQPKSSRRLAWLMTLLPLILLAAVLVYLFLTGGGLEQLATPPGEQLSLGRVRIAGPSMMEVSVVNDGPQSVTIAQVRVDDAYWAFRADPSATVPRFGRAVLHIPYPWVEAEAHTISLITGLGATFDAEVLVAVESPRPSLEMMGRFGLVGVYVGVVPVLLGVLWYPLMRRMTRQAMSFILAVTVGLLLFLAVGTWLDAIEFSRDLPAFWQGVPMVVFVALLSLGVLLVVGGSQKKGHDSSPLSLAYLIALGIGLHNLGEGLAIGSAFAVGEAVLGKFLILGFTLHNITEGVGIASPLVRKNPGLSHFVLLVLLAGAPAVLGMWIGGFSFSPVLAAVFLAVGLGAILQVIWEVGKLVMRERRQAGASALDLVSLGGVFTGVTVMYFTAFLVKF